MQLEEIEIKFLLYQILAIAVIWTGMAFFFSKMDELSKIIFYVVTSWLLFLIVIFVKQIINKRNNPK
ncbi:hypothetical protein [Virgibacillus oceani]|uniref:Uncharacterized protein n=1 Tax=Virgibacillus oceani TaxID=1479511 RepID=A0A917HCL7_9BACI|nr:hypothetical protein [Virgibacillus oceani]GGG74578.1 hypothetical protein GCM10011398_19080 [Virgibacillus oceani]